MWGCTEIIDFGIEIIEVVPTHVGVYRILFYKFRKRASCPHACGGVPNAIGKTTPVMLLAPTHVGVYRENSMIWYDKFSCPHACGGVP